MIDEILSLAQICEEIPDRKTSSTDTWSKLSYLTTDLEEMRNVINKQRSVKKVGKLVLTEKNHNNIHEKTDDISDNIVKVVGNDEEFRSAIGLNIHSESNVNEVNVSFNENENYNRYDNQNESNKNYGHYNDNIVDDLADYNKQNKVQPNDIIRKNNKNKYNIMIGKYRKKNLLRVIEYLFMNYPLYIFFKWGKILLLR